MTAAKRKQKLQARLGELRTRNGQLGNRCWVCLSVSGSKTSRMSYGTRCTRCIEKGLTTPDTLEYTELKAQLEKILHRR